ncbi:MAG: hypothetical protein K6U74_01445, partial [Firmicutes bacterium]|nr:hypothetical protein [Bacillota bacterium]
MAKRKGSAVKIIPERIYDWSGGQNNAVNVALLNDNESRLLQNYSLDEKGTLFPAKGSLKRYASDLGSAAVAGMGTFYKSDKTSRLLIGLEDGKLYADSPHLINTYDTQANFNGGQNFAVQADAGGKLWPMIITTGFEDGLFVDFHTRDSGWAIDTAVFKTGAKSAKGTGTTQKLIREFGINAGQVYIKLACRFAETNQAHYPVIFKSPTDTEIQVVVAGSDGHFKYHNGTALANFPTDKTYTANTWYVVEVWVRGGTFWVSIDGQSLTPDGLAMKDTANAAQSQAAKYVAQNAGATAATMWLDDVTISLLDPVFTRSSVAYKQDGTQVAVNLPRYEYTPLPAPVWQDTFDTDQLATQYTSGGDVAGTPTVSGGVLTYTGGTQATLIKNNLLLQDCAIVVNSDQAHSGGIIGRYQDNNNYYLLVLQDDSGINPNGNLELYRRVNGSYTMLAQVNLTWPRGTPKQIKFTLHGSRLEAYFDGVKVISVTDSTFTGGGVGLRNNSATAFRVLDFTVYYAQQGLMVEEGTTNLLTANQASVEGALPGGYVASGTGTVARSTDRALHFQSPCRRGNG